MRKSLRIAALLLASAALVAITTAPAEAHNYLVATNPAADSTITTLPAEFSVTTNEALLDIGGTGSGFAIQVVDANGLYYGDGCTTIVDATLSTAAALGEAGDYTLIWQLVSEDGHTVSGEFGFTWAPTDNAVASVGTPTPPNCGGPAQEATSPADAAPVRSDANLTDVLWAGGAIVAVLLAAAATFFVLTRKRKA